MYILIVIPTYTSCQFIVDIATIRIAVTVAHKFVGRTHILLYVGCTLFVGRMHTFVGQIHIFIGRMNTFCRSDVRLSLGRVLRLGHIFLIDKVIADLWG